MPVENSVFTIGLSGISKDSLNKETQVLTCKRITGIIIQILTNLGRVLLGFRYFQDSRGAKTT